MFVYWMYESVRACALAEWKCENIRLAEFMDAINTLDRTGSQYSAELPLREQFNIMNVGKLLYDMRWKKSHLQTTKCSNFIDSVLWAHRRFFVASFYFSVFLFIFGFIKE